MPTLVKERFILRFVENDNISPGDLLAPMNDIEIPGKLVETLIESDVLKLKRMRDGRAFYRFEYVGIITAGNLTIVIAPKIVKNEEVTDRENEIISRSAILGILTYYNKNLNSQTVLDDMFVDPFGDSSMSRLAIVRELLDDFLNSGLYWSRLKSTSVDGSGDIDWDHTINAFLPILTESGPVYDQLSTMVSTVDETNYIRHLHSLILNSCAQFISELGISDPSLNLKDSSLYTYDFHHSDRDSSVLHRQLSRTFNDIQANKIRLMISFLEIGDNNFESQANFLGCRKFDRIWEDACNHVIGNDFVDDRHDGTWIDSAPGSISFGKQMTPEWQIKDLEINGQVGLKPDLVTFVKVDDELFDIHIMDAKYYNLVGRSHAPGASDVAKQHGYEIGFRANPANTNRLTNSFSVPGLGSRIERLGRVSIPSFIDIQCSPINVLSFPFERVMEEYSRESGMMMRDEFISCVKKC